MAFSKLKNGAAAVPPAAPAPQAAAPAPTPAPVAKPAPAPVVHEAVVEKEERALAVGFFDGNAGADLAAGLMAVTEVQDQAPNGMLFPILQLAGGKSGGTFAPIDAVEQAVADQLPQGKKPIECVFLGYRTELAAWPVGYDDRGEDTGRPAWSCAIPCHNPHIAKLVAEACGNYQFTKRVDKRQWDFATSDIGHLRATLQLLVYLPSVDDVIVIQTPGHYTSWKSSIENLSKQVDPKTKVLGQFPCVIRAKSTPKNINGFETTEHVLTFDAALTETGAGWYKQMVAWREVVRANPEQKAAIEEWMSGADRPATDAMLARIKKASIFKP